MVEFKGKIIYAIAKLGIYNLLDSVLKNIIDNVKK